MPGTGSRFIERQSFDTLSHCRYSKLAFHGQLEGGSQTELLMTRILHVTQGLSRGGASRCMIAMAKHSTRQGSYRHAIAPLNASETDPLAVSLARQEDIEVIEGLDQQGLLKEVERADILQINWWSTPEVDAFLRSPLPPTRLVIWAHVAGDSPPQVITEDLLKFCDRFVGGSPYTYHCRSVSSLPDDLRRRKASMMYGAADFTRLEGTAPIPHKGYNVGYIGTVDYVKMHPQYVKMSAAVTIDEAKFIVCGNGHIDVLQHEAELLGKERSFEFLGYVEDIRSVIQILDVFGYPLTPDTYAASELILQEVMYVGIPPVVFASGGIRDLVMNEFSGLVVRDPVEYTQALEHLYHSPQERRRLGENARNYARQVFRADKSGQRFNLLYDQLLLEPKKLRVWGKESLEPLISQPVTLDDILDRDPAYVGALRFIASLGIHGTPFRASFEGEHASAVDWRSLLEADEVIYSTSTLVRNLGLGWYSQHYRQDRYLKYWLGLATLGAGVYQEGAAYLAKAIELGMPLWRAGLHLAQALFACGRSVGARDILAALLKEIPDHAPARELLDAKKS